MWRYLATAASKPCYDTGDDSKWRLKKVSIVNLNYKHDKKAHLKLNFTNSNVRAYTCHLDYVAVFCWSSM